MHIGCRSKEWKRSSNLLQVIPSYQIGLSPGSNTPQTGNGNFTSTENYFDSLEKPEIPCAFSRFGNQEDFLLVILGKKTAMYKS